MENLIPTVTFEAKNAQCLPTGEMRSIELFITMQCATPDGVLHSSYFVEPYIADGLSNLSQSDVDELAKNRWENDGDISRLKTQLSEEIFQRTGIRYNF